MFPSTYLPTGLDEETNERHAAARRNVGGCHSHTAGRESFYLTLVAPCALANISSPVLLQMLKIAMKASNTVLSFFLPGLGVTNDPQALGPPDHLWYV